MWFGGSVGARFDANFSTESRKQEVHFVENFSFIFSFCSLVRILFVDKRRHRITYFNCKRRLDVSLTNFAFDPCCVYGAANFSISRNTANEH